MYLKSIEVHGFKSFANKILFEFHNGITGIVGPNGSGKSNVADAVRWVLGEQKVRQLRSTSMQDVIFAGTENRKPQSYAYVAITLDNSDHQLPLDYEEVTVARRVYRSGESEYLINGSACRLRDVNELFYDTGIGKEGYSIIGQGQIDKILSGKPEERRELFDEAAGIVKFKRRKQTAQRKLENEQQNLVRVNDILSELEKQLAPLERQSETARTYLKKREELKECDVQLFGIEAERISKQLKENEGSQKIARDQHQEAQKKQEEVRTGSEQMEQEIAQNEQQIEQIRQELSNAGMTREKLEGQLNVLQEQIHGAKQNREIQKLRLQAIDNDLKQREQSRQEYEKEQAECLAILQGIEERKQAIYGELSKVRNQAASYESQIEDNRKSSIDLLNQKAVFSGEQKRLDTMLEQISIRKAALNQRLLEQQSTEVDLQKNLQSFQEAYDQVCQKITEQQKLEVQIGQKLDEWRVKERTAVTQLEEAKNHYHKDASRLESMRNIAERYDGYGNSIRRVMEQKNTVSGIHGVVADLIRVEKKYETAIETALGGSIQNIVTEDETTAKQMIAYLKEHRYGRATFLPLTSVKKRDNSLRTDVLQENGVIGYADTLVHTADRYQGIAGYLLGRTLVVDHIDHAIGLARKYRYSLRIVTLEGESLQPGGSMTGGAFRNNSNLLGRSREISVLEKSVLDLKTQMQETTVRLEDIRTARELLKEDLSEVRESIQSARLEQNTARMNLERRQDEQKQQAEFYADIQKENCQLQQQTEEIRAEQEALREKKSDSAGIEEELQEENLILQEKLDQLQKEIQTGQQRQSEILMEESSARQKEVFLRENLEHIREEIEKLLREQSQIHISSSNQEAETRQKQQEQSQIRDRIAAAAQKHTEQEAQLKVLQEEKETLAASYREYFRQREDITQQISRLEQEIFRLESQKEKLEESMEHLTSYMWEEYELTLHAADVKEQEVTASPSEIRSRITDLKNEIRRLGNVNVNAIEEYKEVSERFAFMDTQRDDLVEAEKTLQGIIQELDEGMRKQFHEKFAEIQREFDLAFKELFGGGKGTLTLTDGEDVLECGVSITAQPPGKKLQNMMQLSGGEKALTAIALLFAIQNLKPSPFCLLDEIEAALDDSNVDRFAGYLHKLTKNTQFIIITHRRGTMNAADRLYGITMQEKGVSTLVSVNLIEKELDA